MTNVISIIRIAILLSLAIIGIALFFNYEQDTDESIFFIHFLFDKVAAFICCIIWGNLYKRWSKSDRWISAYEVWNMKGYK